MKHKYEYVRRVEYATCRTTFTTFPSSIIPSRLGKIFVFQVDKGPELNLEYFHEVDNVDENVFVSGTGLSAYPKF